MGDGSSHSSSSAVPGGVVLRHVRSCGEADATIARDLPFCRCRDGSGRCWCRSGLARHRAEYQASPRSANGGAPCARVGRRARRHHFATWISSLSFTTVAASAVLVQTLCRSGWPRSAGSSASDPRVAPSSEGMAIAVAGTLGRSLAEGSGGGSRAPVGDVWRSPALGRLRSAIYACDVNLAGHGALRQRALADRVFSVVLRDVGRGAGWRAIGRRRTGLHGVRPGEDVARCSCRRSPRGPAGVPGSHDVQLPARTRAGLDRRRRSLALAEPVGATHPRLGDPRRGARARDPSSVGAGVSSLPESTWRPPPGRRRPTWWRRSSLARHAGPTTFRHRRRLRAPFARDTCRRVSPHSWPAGRVMSGRSRGTDRRSTDGVLRPRFPQAAWRPSPVPRRSSSPIDSRCRCRSRRGPTSGPRTPTRRARGGPSGRSRRDESCACRRPRWTSSRTSRRRRRRRSGGSSTCSPTAGFTAEMLGRDPSAGLHRARCGRIDLVARTASATRETPGRLRAADLAHDLRRASRTTLDPAGTTSRVDPRARAWLRRCCSWGSSRRRMPSWRRRPAPTWVVVSNHGGRTGWTPALHRSTRCRRWSRRIGGRIPVLVDGGVRRGTDVVRRWRSGRLAVTTGRPAAWGLAARRRGWGRRRPPHPP